MEPSRRGPPRAAIVAAIVLIALQLISVHLIPTSLWGFSAGAFAPRWIEPLLLVIAVLLLVPRIAAAVSAYLGRAWSWLSADPSIRNPRIMVMAGGAFAIFMLLRSRNGFFGDGFLRIEQLAAGKPALRSAGFLDILIHHEVWRVLKAAGFTDASRGYAVVSAAAGAVAVAFMPPLSRRLSPEPATRWMVPALLLTMGSVQLFFGYAEDYTLRELAAVAYFLAALRALDGQSPRPAFVVLALGIACHLTFLALVPSAMALLIRERHSGAIAAASREGAARSKSRRAVTKHSWVAGGAIALAVSLAGLALFYLRRQYGGLGALVPPVAGREDAYGWFSPGHFADLANFALLVAPLAPALFVIALLPSSRVQGTGANALVDRLRAHDREMLFWTLAAGGVLGAVFLLDPKLGSRDWDLMSFAGIPLMLLGIRLAVGRAGPAAARTAAGTVALLGAAILHVVPWIVVNHDLHRSADLAMSMVQEDPHYSSGPTPRFMNLGVIYERQGMADYSLRLHERAVRVRPGNALAHFNLGTALLQSGRTDEAAHELERALALNPDEVQARAQLGVAYGVQGRIAESLRELRIAVRQAPDNAQAWLDLGVSYRHAGLPESTAVAWENLLALTPRDGGLHSRLAGVYLDMGAVDRARAHAIEALRLNPGDPAAREILASLAGAAGTAAGETSPRQP